MYLQTKRLSLVPLSVRHYATTFQYATDPENTQLMCFMPCDDGEEVMAYLEKCEIQWQKELPDYLDAAILLDDRHIGAVSIELLDEHTTGELGWIIQKAYWGNGYTAEAAACFMQYMTERFGIRRYIAHADSGNAASVRVMEKLGMQYKSTTSGRRNRHSDEERKEVLYELYVD